MNVSARTDYACKALLELSLRWPNQLPLRVNDIADHQNIPIQYLTHILISLKQLGLVHSVRGNKGGYVLARAPKDISLGEVFNNFNESRVPKRNIAPKTKKNNIMESIWKEVTESIGNTLNNINFEDIRQRHRLLEKIPMYTI